FKGEKTGKERVIPIHPELEEAKWMILANPPPYETVLQKVKRRLEKRVGIRFVAHQLRKTFATEIYEAGTPDEVVAELLGHTGSVTRLYAPVTTRMRVEAIQLLDYGNGIRPTSLNAKSRPSRKPVQAVELPRAHGSAAIASVTPITSITRAANNPVDSLDDRRKLILNRLKDIDPKAATLVLRYLRSRPAAGHQHRCLRVLGTNIKKWYLFDIDKLMWHWTGSELPAASPTCKLNYRVVPDPVAATVWASLIASAAVMCKPCFRKTTEPPHHLLHHSLSSIDPRWEETMQSLRDIPW
ncbi:MAG TPA: site-specific integrase, partial [Actinomycetota bacterium]|nr:site-specific integrase [Actinomycetota bacterium]